MEFKEPNACLEHPLGILCRCSEYKDIIDKFKIYTISTLSPILTGFNVEPIASGKVIWTPKKTEKFREFDEPLVFYCKEERPKINEDNVEKRWIPVRTDIVSPKLIALRLFYPNLHKVSRFCDIIDLRLKCPQYLSYMRPNECYLHQTHLNTQSAETTTLTDMLPHRGRPIKRNDIRWDVGSHKTPIQMTDELQTRWTRATGCFTPWANAFTVSIGAPPF